MGREHKRFHTQPQRRAFSRIRLQKPPNHQPAPAGHPRRSSVPASRAKRICLRRCNGKSGTAEVREAAAALPLIEPYEQDNESKQTQARADGVKPCQLGEQS